jgi:putative DNA primase/helicase
LTPYAEFTTGDADILRRRFCLIDVDPIRPKGIASTNEELERALGVRDQIVDYLTTQGWPTAVRAMSGNGGHAIYAIDLPNDDDSRDVVRGCLAALAHRFDTPLVTIDRSVFNAARISKLYGTVARKGDTTSDRPHRRAAIEDCPADLRVVNTTLLQQLAREATPRASSGARPSRARTSERREVIDMALEFQQRGWYLRQLRDGKHAVRCPWRDAHSSESGPTETVLFEPRSIDGLWGFQCQHAHCAHRTIKDVWQLFRPSAPASSSRGSASTSEPPPDPGVSIGSAPEDRLTEAGAAERLARLYGDRLRYDHRRGRWLLWQQHRWAADADAAITRLALAFVRAWQCEALDIVDRDRREAVFRTAVRLEKRDALISMLRLAADLRPLADAGDGWDIDPWLLAASNGVIDLRTGVLRDGRREDRITMTTAVAYDPEARSTRWDGALRSILPTDDTIHFFQAAMGYSATGDMRRDCWFLGQGSGRNGKGTLLHPVRRALGDYAAELPAAVFDARRDGAPYDLAILPGKRLVVSSESGDMIKIHHDRIKQITGGDPIRAANKYEKSFEFQPVCKLWLSANRKPRVSDDSPAFWARVMLVPFPVSFVGREDRALRPDLESDPAHQAAILAWVVRGAVRYHHEGLEPSSTIRSATAQYEQECDPLADFLADACELEPASEIGAAELYEHYKLWASKQGLSDRERLSATAFGTKAKGRFKNDRKHRGRVYFGVARGRL